MKTEKKTEKERSNSDEKREDRELIEERGANSNKEFEDDQVSLEKTSPPVHHQPPAEMKVDLTVEKQGAPETTVEHVEKLELRENYDDGVIDIC